jgi:hypothetical protein
VIDVELRVVQAQLRLRLLDGWAVSMAALAAVERGVSSPSLCELAALTKPTLGDALPLFERAIAELDFPPLADDAAFDVGVREPARAIAQRILDGTLTASLGVQAIAKLCKIALEPQLLLDFRYLNDEMWEAMGFLPDLDRAARTLALALLQK